MMWLAWARLTIALSPLERWRGFLGWPGRASDPEAVQASRLAADVEWAARRAPFATKCLPRAMTLSWLLQRRQIAHVVTFAVRPGDQRGADDDLHAWVEVNGLKILGDLPGPWVETLCLGESKQF